MRRRRGRDNFGRIETMFFALVFMIGAAGAVVGITVIDAVKYILTIGGQ